jgi:hypothetical protein
LAAFFNGVCGAVVGVIAIVAVNILKASVGLPGSTSAHQDDVIVAAQDSIAAILFIVSLAIIYKFTHKYTVIFLVLCGALAGQFLFI